MKTQEKKVKYICANCGARQRAAYIRAMCRAGWRLRHLKCHECGQQAIRDAYTTYDKTGMPVE